MNTQDLESNFGSTQLTLAAASRKCSKRKSQCQSKQDKLKELEKEMCQTKDCIKQLKKDMQAIQKELCKHSEEDKECIRQLNKDLQTVQKEHCKHREEHRKMFMEKLEQIKCKKQSDYGCHEKEKEENCGCAGSKAISEGCDKKCACAEESQLQATTTCDACNESTMDEESSCGSDSEFGD